jgi:D-aminoacyl-tRNA deacylase
LSFTLFSSTKINAKTLYNLEPLISVKTFRPGRKLVAGSIGNPASENIISELGDTSKVVWCKSSIVELEELKDLRNTLVIVASSHKSEAGVLSLSVHSPGNFSTAGMGGEDRRLSIAPALFLGEGIRKFSEIKKREGLMHEATLEVTHHGPSFDTPVIFVELGSDEKGWRDKKGAKAAAEVITHLLDSDLEGISGIGIGGPHYAPNFTKLALGGENFGHICPKYSAEILDIEMLAQMAEKTIPRPEYLALDWKGVPGQARQKILGWEKEIGLPIRRVR